MQAIVSTSCLIETYSSGLSDQDATVCSLAGPDIVVQDVLWRLRALSRTGISGEAVNVEGHEIRSHSE